MPFQVKILASAIFGLVVFGCAHARVVTFDSSGSPLTVHRAALYPETIEYNSSNDKFLLSSFRDGAIYEVDQAGTASLLVGDSRLCSVLGIAVDAQLGRLWAVNSDLGASVKRSLLGPKTLAGVGIYDLQTGKALRYVDLSPLFAGPHLLNGLALDASGNAYVTDSFSPVIYKVDSDGVASVFLKDERFRGDGGVTLVGKNNLVVISNKTPVATSNSAFSLSSDDGWATAKVTGVQQLGDVYPTTAVLRRGTLYVVHSKLNELIALPSERKAELQVEATIRPIARVAL